YDVDDAAALRRLHDELFAGGAPAPGLAPHDAVHTADLMMALGLAMFNAPPGRAGAERIPNVAAV
ncbi:hypothetical protein ACSLVQ_28780, partial [Klebsiella pneumoniae]|uniref:hypothetical protein n=1 Tax=Klebsiella pneumoniae TaxID=573 RepID=UPI003EE378F1